MHKVHTLPGRGVNRPNHKRRLYARARPRPFGTGRTDNMKGARTVNYDELRAAFEKAEKEYTAAYRRAQWLERRMMDAQTDDEYNDYARRLEAQEAALKPLGLAVIRARYEYTAGQMQVQ